MTEPPLTEAAIVFNVPRGTAYITYQRIVNYATSFVYYVLLIRFLSLSQIGVVSLLAAAMSLFTTFTQLSLPVAATRFISANTGTHDPSSAGGVAKTSLRLLLTLAGPGLVLATLASPIIGPVVFKTPHSITLLIIAFTAGFLFDLTTLYGAYFLGIGHYAEIAYQNILYVPLSRGLGLVLAYKLLGVLRVPVGWALGGLATLLLSLYLWKGKLSNTSTSNFQYDHSSPSAYPSSPQHSSPSYRAGETSHSSKPSSASSNFRRLLHRRIQCRLPQHPLDPRRGSTKPRTFPSCYTSNGPRAVSAKLGVAMRLVNLTVLPSGAALAAVAPTALEAVYGSTPRNQAIPFAILAVTIIFSAQSLLLITTLQAVGNTKPILGISLAATIIDLSAVGLGANVLGTTAGAVGRALLALGTMLLAWQYLRRTLPAPVTRGLGKATVLAVTTAGLLATTDHLLAYNLRFSPLARVPLLTAVIAIGFLAVSRALSVFTADDFELLENALPRFLHPALRVFERLLVPPLEFL